MTKWVGASASSRRARSQGTSADSAASKFSASISSSFCRPRMKGASHSSGFSASAASLRSGQGFSLAGEGLAQKGDARRASASAPCSSRAGRCRKPPRRAPGFSRFPASASTARLRSARVSAPKRRASRRRRAPLAASKRVSSRVSISSPNKASNSASSSSAAARMRPAPARPAISATPSIFARASARCGSRLAARPLAIRNSPAFPRARATRSG